MNAKNISIYQTPRRLHDVRETSLHGTVMEIYAVESIRQEALRIFKATTLVISATPIRNVYPNNK